MWDENETIEEGKRKKPSGSNNHFFTPPRPSLINCVLVVYNYFIKSTFDVEMIAVKKVNGRKKKNMEAEQTYDSPQKHTVVEGWNEEDVMKTRNKKTND